MADHTLDIDHVVIGVRDLERAADIYRRLGFTLSPRGLHSASMGTANHTIMLRDDYFELLAAVAATERNAHWRQEIGRGEGVIGMALATEDVAAARAAWREEGLDPGEVVAFSRPVARAGHAPVEARFETAHLPDETIPGVGIFACRHVTPEAVWLPELLAHANGATAIAALTIAAASPAEAVARWRSVMGDPAIAETAAGARLELPAHRIDLVMDAAMEEGRQKVTEIHFTTQNPAACREVFASGGVAFTAEGNALRVGAAEACGVALIFRPGAA